MVRPGIYRILNVNDGKAYVGSAVDSKKRLYVHRWLLKRGKHHSPHLQRAFDRDGEAAFSFAVIERCDRGQLLKREQLWINALRTADDRFGYNLCGVAGTREGVPQPASVSETMRKAHAGKPKSAEHRAKIGAGNRGKVRSEETKEKLRRITIAQFSDPDARKRAAEFGAMAKPWLKGRRLPDEIREKISAAHFARWEGVERKPRKKRDQRKPPDQLQKRGPKPGTPRHDRRALTAEQVIEICRLKAEGSSYSALERQFSLNRASLHSIVTGKTYQKP